MARAWSREQTRLGRRQALPVIVCGLLSTGLAIAQSWCIAMVLAHALARIGAAGSSRLSVIPLASFACLGIGRTILSYAADRAAAAAGAAGRRRLRADAVRAVLAEGPAAQRHGSTGTLVSLLVDRIEALDGFFGRWIPAATLALLSPLLVLVVVLGMQFSAAVVLLCCGLAVPVAQAVFGIGAGRASRQQFTAMSRLQSRFLDRVRGISTLVVAGRHEAEAHRLHETADELRRRTMRVLRVAFLSSAALDCCFAVALVAISLIDGRILLSGGDRLSGFGTPLLPRSLFVLLLVPEFFAPLRSFALAYQDRMQVAGAADALRPLSLDPAAPGTAASDPLSPAITPLAAATTGVAVAFHDVGFSWDPGRPPALCGVSFRVAPGETVVLSGPSGSGKTTIVELLLGFVTPDSGRITLDGVDARSLAPAAINRMMSWIGQQPLLFAGTLRDNIRLAHPDATEDELARAIHAARVDGFAAALPRGLDTVIGEGGYGLSGGQAQRIAIARAFLRGAPLLLLDEPTSHLDPDTETDVFESLRQLARGRTVILAGHSAAVLGFASRRIVLADGRIATGTPIGVPA